MASAVGNLSDVRGVLEMVDIVLPDPGATGVENPLSDAGHGWLVQLSAYHEYNIRK